MTNYFGSIKLVTFFIFCVFVFINLNWGSPYYFHPDERNIASAVTRINISSNLNPEFFAYGGLPIYSIYLTGIVNNFLQNPLNFSDYSVLFEDAVIISRLFSAFLTLFTILLIYKITQKLSNDNFAAIALILSTLSVGFIQYSRFGTFEMWLSFFYLLLVYQILIFLEKKDLKTLILISIIFGVCISIKVSSAVLIILPLIAAFKVSMEKKTILKKLIELLRLFLLFSYLSSAVFLLTNPFVLIDLDAFISSMNYETAVATGLSPVFYTGSFVNTTPILFQFEKVLPFLINPLLTAFMIPILFFLTYSSVKTRNFYVLFLILSFTLIFLSQSILYVKWARYVVPSISFIYILTALSLFRLGKTYPRLLNFLLVVIISTSFVFFVSFVKTVIISSDTRIEASEFAENEIISNSYVLSEVYDLGIVPFNAHLTNIELFNFYDLDGGNISISMLEERIKKSEYLILTSQRVLKSRTENPQYFPVASKFYDDLLNDRTTYMLIYKTSCDIFCKITYLGNPIHMVEETTNIFDRPIVQIFRNEKNDTE